MGDCEVQAERDKLGLLWLPSPDVEIFLCSFSNIMLVFQMGSVLSHFGIKSVDVARVNSGREQGPSAAIHWLLSALLHKKLCSDFEAVRPGNAVCASSRKITHDFSC